MKKNSKSKLRFDTKENVRALRFKRFALGFCCFFVLLAGVSFLLLLKYYDFDLSKVVDHSLEEESSVQETETSVAPQVSGTRNYLLLCTADDSNLLRFVVVVRANMDTGKLSVLPVSVFSTVDAPGCSGTLEHQMDFGGEKQLVLAIETFCGTKIDKFVRSRDSGFKAIANYMGGLEINLVDGIDFRSEKLTAVIGAGEQTMNGDTLLKYIRCFEADSEKQAEIISQLISQKITQVNYAKADAFYTKAINLVNSDISVFDFSQMKHGFEALLCESETVTASVVTAGG